MTYLFKIGVDDILLDYDIHSLLDSEEFHEFHQRNLNMPPPSIRIRKDKKFSISNFHVIWYKNICYYVISNNSLMNSTILTAQFAYLEKNINAYYAKLIKVGDVNVPIFDAQFTDHIINSTINKKAVDHPMKLIFVPALKMIDYHRYQHTQVHMKLGGPGTIILDNGFCRSITYL